MLTTRCPDCQTTFRITSAVLHRAAGQVRCGHCKTIFDAFDSLTDARRAAAGLSGELSVSESAESVAEQPYETDTAAQLRPTHTSAAELDDAPGPNQASTPLTDGAMHAQIAAAEYAHGTTPALSAEIPDAQPTAGAQLAEPVTEASEAAPEAATQPPSQDPHTEVLDPPEHAAAGPQTPDEEPPAHPAPGESTADAPAASAPLDASPQPFAATAWRPLERSEPEAPGWRLAAALAAGALLLQGAHHFRASLAHAPYLGAALERLYSLAGQPIEHFDDPQDFSIVDWAAAAQESDADTPGILEITAGVRNESDAPQRYPMLSLELTDRWETVIGARVFAPEEYLGRGVSQDELIRPNSTVTAHLSLVDPGPDAYGFEVDVCVTADAGRIRCKTDMLFE